MLPEDPPPSAPGDVRCSIVIPAGTQLAGLEGRLAEYGERLSELTGPFEGKLVAGDESRAQATAIATRHDWISVSPVSGPGWGLAVRTGLADSRGDLLCFLNWKRTSGQALGTILEYALSSPGLVFRANRRTRDTVQQRFGSLLFNLECRALLGTSAWDVNGTPKVFGRRHERLLNLRRDDDLIDAEFALVCEQEGYHVAEIPIDASPLSGHVPRPDYPASVRLYLGVLGLARAAR
jgi:hypothetical protein